MKAKLTIYTLAIILFVSVLFNVGQFIFSCEQNDEIEQWKTLVEAAQ